MKGSLFCIVLLAAAAADPVPYQSEHHRDCPDMRGVLPEGQAVSDLFGSFVEGLSEVREKPSPCFNSTMRLVKDFVSLYGNLGELLSGNASTIFTVLGSYGHLSANFEDIAEDCDFAELWEKVEKLISPTGAGVLFLRYSSNSDKFATALDTFGDCSANLRACGRSAGELLRTLLDWGL